MFLTPSGLPVRVRLPKAIPAGSTAENGRLDQPRPAGPPKRPGVTVAFAQPPATRSKTELVEEGEDEYPRRMLTVNLPFSNGPVHLGVSGAQRPHEAYGKWEATHPSSPSVSSTATYIGPPTNLALGNLLRHTQGAVSEDASTSDLLRPVFTQQGQRRFFRYRFPNSGPSLFAAC